MIKKLLFNFIASLGVVSFSVTILFALVFGDSLLNSDDAYVMGWAASWLVVPAVLLYTVFDRWPYKRVTNKIAYIGYLLALEILLLYPAMVAELHGKALTVILMVVVGLAGVLLYPVMVRQNNNQFIIMGVIAWILYMIGYLIVILNRTSGV